YQSGKRFPDHLDFPQHQQVLPFSLYTRLEFPTLLKEPSISSTGLEGMHLSLCCYWFAGDHMESKYSGIQYFDYGDKQMTPSPDHQETDGTNN
nr:hypothetical protein [Tanacetum cinerariifolium]